MLEIRSEAWNGALGRVCSRHPVLRQGQQLVAGLTPGEAQHTLVIKSSKNRQVIPKVNHGS